MILAWRNGMSLTQLTPRAQAKRDAILAAAQELFIQHGFGSTSMDAIAVAANVSKQTLYRYYQHKEALFIATMQHMVFEHTTMTMFAELRETPIESLPQLEHALLTWARVVLEKIMQPDYVALVRVLIAEIPRFPTLGSLFFSVLPQEGASSVKALLERALARGIISSVDLDAAIRLFVGPLLMYIIGALVRPDSSLHPPAPERLATHVRLFLHGVACHIQQETW
jgi:TetR/AcrR family transcriptional regulator, mexJK operon transcriptional repressor